MSDDEKPTTVEVEAEKTEAEPVKEKERERDDDGAEEVRARDADDTAVTASEATPAPAAALGVADDVLVSQLQARAQARGARDYATADRIRDELRGAGIRIDDRTQSWSDDKSGRRGNTSGPDYFTAVGPPPGAAGRALPAPARAGAARAP
jgi:cysteinyl-tRNA synthetase